ncbi:hypothetical protein [Catenulispora subtropica]|uniref:Fibronectin type-III domain-containing protein n=1 Tax=Catenulispora subtropica TaxID=450798 RepID=A0ABN2SH82_9ACTN
MSGQSAPRFPGLRGYPVLKAGLATLGLRHLADLVAPETPPFGAETDATGRACFLVVDGIWIGRPGLWRRLDHAAIAQVRADAERRFGAHAPTATELLGLLDAALDDYGDILRQALLYQLVDIAGRAAGRPGAVTEQQLTDLGVHSTEAAAVLVHVHASVRLDARAADAAERLADHVADRRLSQAARLLARLPADHGDWRLAQLAQDIEQRIGTANGFLAEARALEDDGDPEECATRYLQAARLVSDERHAHHGLLRSAIRLADSRVAAAHDLQISATDEGLVLELRRSREADVSWSVLRLYDDATDGEPAFEDTDFAGSVTDTAVEFGRSVRYIAIPLRDGVIDAVPVATDRIRHTPEVQLPAVRDTPYGVQLSWRAPDRADQVRVLRCGDEAAVEVECQDDGALDAGVEEGDYEYRVQCGYVTTTGTVWSDGVTVTVRVGRWPAPVRQMQVEVAKATEMAEATTVPPDAADRGLPLRIAWSAPEVGTADIAIWPYGATSLGSDISAFVRHRPVGVPGLTTLAAASESPEVRFTARPGHTTRFLAVSTLGDRAVAGPSALVQVVPAPRDLRVSRPANTANTANTAGTANTATVEFSWPDPAVLVAVSWQVGGTTRRALLSRSRYPATGFRIAVDRSACQITVEPLGRPDADLVVTSAATVLLPALPPPFRPWPVNRPTASFTPPTSSPGPTPLRRRRWWAPWTWFRRRRP